MHFACSITTKFCPFSNASGEATLSVTPQDVHSGCTCTLCARYQSPGAYRAKCRSTSTDQHRQSLLSYLRKGARGAAAATLSTQPHAAKQLGQLIAGASLVEFIDHGRGRIYGEEHYYSMEAKVDGHKIDFRWDYELWSDSD